jgi:hypothetical protein
MIFATRAMVEFLHIDAQTGLVFSGIALATNNPEKKGRTTRAARRAYEAITRLRGRVHLTDRDTMRLDYKLERLRNELEVLGEVF